MRALRFPHEVPVVRFEYREGLLEQLQRPLGSGGVAMISLKLGDDHLLPRDDAAGFLDVVRRNGKSVR